MIDQSLNLVAGLKIVKKGKTLFVLTTVRRGDIPVPQEFSYAYTPNSSLIATVTSPAHIVSNVYEPDRDVLASKVNKKLDTTTVSSYFYTVNNYGQRTGVTTGGTAFSGTPSWLWGYNNKGEIVKADSSEANNDRSYQYDGIGNRLKAADSLTLPTQNNYTTNALNQYFSITNPQSTILNPSYDDDGNMTSGPLPANVNANSTLTWDGENRLIQAQVNGGNTVTFIYDSQSRRIAETVGSAITVYIYDGWNPIAEYSFSSLPALSSTLTKSYTWGMDLSGSIQGAGGVGGLLAVAIHDQQSSIFYPLFDGNGNVSEYLDSTGAIAAHYEYDPFGKTTVATGSKAADFAHRFSTKPLDLTTGLYYYGYRFYDPETGRWPSRDPIEERGGINLYGFVGNDGVNTWDYLGMMKYEFKHIKKVSYPLNNIGPYGQPGSDTDSIFISGPRRASSRTTVTASGYASCNTIDDSNVLRPEKAVDGGSIYVYAVPESGDEHCQWEFTLRAKVIVETKHLPSSKGGGTVIATAVHHDAVRNINFARAVNNLSAPSVEDNGDVTFRKWIPTNKKHLIAKVRPVLRVSHPKGVVTGIIIIAVIAERKV